MEAIILRDIFDSKQSCEKLFNKLKGYGISVKFFNSMEMISHFIKDNKGSYLYFRNPYFDFNWDLKELLHYIEESKAEVLCMQSDSYIQEVMFFKASQISRFDKTIPIYKEDSRSFTIYNRHFNLKKPTEDTPLIIVNSYNRPEYLKLTLDSLNYSIQDESQPICIGLNDPISLDIAKKFKENYKNCDVWLSSENVALGILSIMLQIYKPKYYIGVEEDFILPINAIVYYKNWPQLFVDRLSHFDLVGWGCSQENFPYAIKDYDKNHLKDFKNGILWDYSNNYTLMAQCLCSSTEFFKDISKEKGFYLDTLLFDNTSKGYCTPTLNGYHIGWNNNQNYPIKLNQERWPDKYGWNIPTELTNIETNKTYKMCANAI